MTNEQIEKLQFHIRHGEMYGTGEIVTQLLEERKRLLWALDAALEFAEQGWAHVTEDRVAMDWDDIRRRTEKLRSILHAAQPPPDAVAPSKEK